MDIIPIITKEDKTMAQFIERTAVNTLQFIINAQGNTSLKALPNDIWDKVLDRCTVQDENDENNGLIDTSALETEVDSLSQFGQRPPKSKGVGSSSDSTLQSNVRGKVQAVLNVHASELKKEGYEGRFYYRSIKSGDIVTPEEITAEEVLTTPEAEDSEEVTS
tara:strand:+ start:75 stop:563 length:489 start_codon:yes stop_codon:yes gene_type:complete